LCRSSSPIDIHSPQKAEAEALLEAAITEQLGQLGPDQHVMLKLTLPELDDFYADLVKHPNVLRVVALSGGYSRHEANARLARNHGVIASFSRALTEGLSVQESDEEFDAAQNESIAAIYEASLTSSASCCGFRARRREVIVVPLFGAHQRRCPHQR
jgi:fructose-bisphosphate aldolase, class I